MPTGHGPHRVLTSPLSQVMVTVSGPSAGCMQSDQAMWTPVKVPPEIFAGPVQSQRRPTEVKVSRAGRMVIAPSAAVQRKSPPAQLEMAAAAVGVPPRA